MTKRWRYTLGLLLIPFTLFGQFPMETDTTRRVPARRHPQNRPVNFGIKGGFTASLLLVSELDVNNVSVKEIQNNYKIGYFGSLFMRINFDRHFLQPELSYTINRSNITFEKPDQEGNPTGITASITSSIHSIDIPVIYGYNVIKEGPYGLAIFGGPKLRFIWNKASKVTFENFDRPGIQESLTPMNLSFTAGVAVTIARIFFDFRYDIGLHNISRRVTYDAAENKEENPMPTEELRFNRRDNVLSFSLGVFF
ncbi:MAG: PorT family protein [Prevotellaceae bacterium]|jgi:hypothetical protein|nr:PorT family protein [Prevotellaceae bacterium]